MFKYLAAALALSLAAVPGVVLAGPLTVATIKVPVELDNIPTALGGGIVISCTVTAGSTIFAGQVFQGQGVDISSLLTAGPSATHSYKGTVSVDLDLLSTGSAATTMGTPGKSDADIVNLARTYITSKHLPYVCQESGNSTLAKPAYINNIMVTPTLGSGSLQVRGTF